MSASPARITSAAPTLGQHTAEVADNVIDCHAPAPTVKSAQLKPPKVSRGGPLEGVRVVELTKVWAGPYAGKLLAFLGAEVIKVESSGNPDEMRAYGGTDINHAPYFLSINPEVLSVELDLKSAAGTDRLRELIAHSDIVINNLRPGRDGAPGTRLPAAQVDQAGHHLGVDQDVGQRRTAGLSDRLRAVLRRIGRDRFSGGLSGRAAARAPACVTGIPPSARPPRSPPSPHCFIAT